MNGVHDAQRLRELQALPLERKIQITQTRIMEWCMRYKNQVYISFSGGKDSTVLLDLTRRINPDIPAVFCDTGLEYPEIREFVKSIENVTWIYPVRYDRKQHKYVRTNFREVIEYYGYPLPSKENARRIHELRHQNLSPEYRKRLMGERENVSSHRSVPKRWHCLIDAPFEVSEQCCFVMKKVPFRQYEKETGRKVILGTMAEESSLRRERWIKYGCNIFDTESKRPQSRPLSFWTEQDILRYLSTYEIPYCSIYGDIVKKEICKPDSELKTTGCHRTGCMFCMFGCHLEKAPNRFQTMQRTHPKQYAYCMKPRSEGGLGLDEVLNYIGVPH